jgi:hypothetical protein
MAGGRHVIAVDLARVHDDRGQEVATLTWGDPVEVGGMDMNGLRVGVMRQITTGDGSVLYDRVVGRIRRPPRSTGLSVSDVIIPRDEANVLQIDHVDTQQGEGWVLETPSGKVMLVDGGENQLFARYLAARYWNTSRPHPMHVECVVVTHGDAGHFGSLPEIRSSEAHDNPLKRIYLCPRRVYHNGLVAGPSDIVETRRLGTTYTLEGKTIVVDLVDDLLLVPDDELSDELYRWKEVLQQWEDRLGEPIEIRRLQRGTDDAFDFLSAEHLGIEVLGPVPTQVGAHTGLLFLGKPGRDSLGHRGTERAGKSAQHTLRGQAIVLRLTYGDWRFLYAGDLSEHSERALVEGHDAGTGSLAAEVMTVPHDSSADFLGAVSPVVSLVSSAHERSRDGLSHPRATLVPLLGAASRGPGSIVLIPELLATARPEGWVSPPNATRTFHAYSRPAYGLVRLRTDGTRLLVSTSAGTEPPKEAYAFTMDGGRPVPQPVVIV